MAMVGEEEEGEEGMGEILGVWRRGMQRVQFLHYSGG